MRTQRRKLKEAKAAHSKPPVQLATLDQFEHGINPDDFSRMENEGGSIVAVTGTLAAAVHTQPDKAGTTIPL